MKKIFLIIIVCCAAFMIVGCRSQPGPAVAAAELKGATTIQYSSFGETVKVPLKKTGITGFFSGVALVDTFLVCIDYRMPKILKVYGQATYGELGEALQRGNGASEFLSIANILPAANAADCWVYDITLGKFGKVNIQRAIKDTGYAAEKQFLLTNECKRAKSPCLINDSTFAACSYSLKDCRFFYFNEQSAMIDKKGELPPRKPNWPAEDPKNKFSQQASIYVSTLARHPSQNDFVVACNKTDRLDLYKNGELKKILRGPDLFEPNVSFLKESGIVTDVTGTATRFAYSYVFATDKYFYCSYSGKDNYQVCSTKILVFDWDGNPKKILELGGNCCYFTIGKANGKMLLYALNPDTGELLVSENSVE